MSYAGPLRDEPIALELSNTIYVAGGAPCDGLADPRSAAAFLRAIAPRLTGERLPAGAWPSAAALVALRAAVRAALQAAVADTPPNAAALSALNAAAARAPRAARAVLRAGRVQPRTDHPGATRADIVLAAFATDAITLITGPRRADLHACGAPSCVLLYLRDHPRRQWCCPGCGNRARQARHYARRRQAGAAGQA